MKIEATKDQKLTKWAAIIATAIWALFFVGSMRSIFYSIAQTLNYPSIFIITPVILSLLFPLSMPMSIYFIWKRYSESRNQDARFFCVAPLIVMAIINIVTTLLHCCFL